MSITKSAADITADVAAWEAEHGPIAPDTDRILPTSEAFLEMAVQHASPKVQRLAAKAGAALTAVREAIWEWDAAALHRAEQEKAKADALAELRKAEQTLAAAKAKARELGATTRGKAVPTGRRAASSPEGLARRRAGIIRSGHDRGLHARKANPDCPACSEIAGGGLSDG